MGGADAQRFVIDAATGALSFVAAPDFEAPTDQDGDNSYVVQVRASDGSLSDLQTITVKVTDVSGTIVGDDGDNVLAGTGENDLIKGLGGNDTAVFNVDFNTVKVVFEGNRVFIESAEGRDEVSGIENFQFTDGVIHLDDGNPLVNDLFYFANNKDVWDAGIDAEAHYNTFGWLEGRDPSALFSTNGYLSANADVRAAGINPLIHFDQFGWKEGRDPSIGFDIEQYLGHNPDLRAPASAVRPTPDKGPLPLPEQPPAGVNPLAHFEQFGRDEGRADLRDDRQDDQGRIRCRVLSARQPRCRLRRSRSLPALRDLWLQGRTRSERLLRYQGLSRGVRRRGGGGRQSARALHDLRLQGRT